MAKREEPRIEKGGWRVIQQWRNAGTWHALQYDYDDQREAWKEFLAAEEAAADLGADAQVDLYDLARGEVLKTARAGPVLVEASHVLTKAELKLRLRALFPKPEPTTTLPSEGEPA